MFRFIRNKNPEPDLCQLDCLFGETVCKLPVNEQIAYCTRLIERSNFQLRQECPKRDSKHLKCLIAAARMEIKRLELAM
jgi:hypothetical protein